VSASPTLVWFRRDLRLRDNPALAAACARGGPVVPVYLREEGDPELRVEGAASDWWLRRSLAALDESLRARGSRLVLARGDAASLLPRLARDAGAGALYWNRRYEPAPAARDEQLRKEMAAAGVEVKVFNSALLHEPEEIANQEGRPFQVFTAFWRHCLNLPKPAPAAGKLPEILPAPAVWPQLLVSEVVPPGPVWRWHAGLAASWETGEAGAAKRLRRFVASGLEAYAEERDRPDHEGTSGLSPHLHLGEIGPRQIWTAVRALARDTGVFPPSRGAAVFLAELGWREFAHHLLFHFPHTPERPLRPEFARFPWADDPGGRKLRAWQRGRTGYPIVDAGMRQLWHCGWMHNRLRMIVASFLVKHLRLPWQEGAAWFWDTLVDADLANNTLGWQWSAGCGADAAPYFRIFAPVLQGRKFDPEGRYVRHWVPELARLPVAHLHAPWEAPAEILAAAGVRLGENYPYPMVDHKEARASALAAFQSLRGGPGR